MNNQPVTTREQHYADAIQDLVMEHIPDIAKKLGAVGHARLPNNPKSN